MAAIIYIATNTINGKEYVGFSTASLHVRKRRHEQAANNDSPTYFHASIRKYGVEAFEWYVLFEHEDEKWTLTEMEPRFIAWHDTFTNGYNMTEGGEGILGCHPKRKPLSEDHKEKIRRALVGKKKSAEHSRNISKGKKGNTRNSAETRRKISESHTGLKDSAQTRQRKSESARRAWARRRAAAGAGASRPD